MNRMPFENGCLKPSIAKFSCCTLKLLLYLCKRFHCHNYPERGLNHMHHRAEKQPGFRKSGFGLLQISWLLLLVLATSCTKQTTGITEISLWALGAEGENVQYLLDDFYKQYPDIRVKVQMVPWTAAQEKLITSYASNNLPDVFQIGNTWIPQFAMLKAITPLNDFLPASSLSAEDYFPGIWQTNLLDTLVYGIPWYIDTRVMFYRTDLLHDVGWERPPQNWDELLRLSQQLRQHFGKKEKYALYLPTNEWASFVIFGLQNGAGLLGENNSFGHFSDPRFESAFSYLMQYHQQGLAPLGISQVTNVYQALADTFIVMYLSGPWNVREFKNWMKGDLADKWMTAPLPGPDSTYPGLSLAGGSSLVINQESGHKKAAWQFIEFLSQTETQLKFYKLVNDLPSRRAAWDDPLLRNDPYMAAFYQQFYHVAPTPKVPEWEQIAFSLIQRYAEFAARGVYPVDECLRRLDLEVDRVLEKRRWMLAMETKE